MTDEERRARLQGVECDIDARLADLWAVVFRPNALTPVLEHDLARETLGAFVRAAYSMGYQDALKEDANGHRGELARRHGYSHA